MAVSSGVDPYPCRCNQTKPTNQPNMINHTTIDGEEIYRPTSFFSPIEQGGLSNLQILEGCEYHPPTVGAHGTFRGKTWRDMHGSCEDVKKMNFFMFRRGLYTTGKAAVERRRRDSFSLALEIEKRVGRAGLGDTNVTDDGRDNEPVNK